MKDWPDNITCDIISTLYFLQINVFIGLGLASLLFSGAGDRFGRKPVALAGAIGVTIAGLLCGLSTKYWHLAVLRGLVGVFMGIGMGPAIALTGKPGQFLLILFRNIQYCSEPCFYHVILYSVAVTTLMLRIKIP